MKITKHWLQRFININKFSDIEIFDALNNIGLEVQHVETIYNKGLLLAKILKVSKVKNSDHLNYCEVLTQNNEKFNVVCGAQNVRVGGLVVYAPVGSTLTNGLQLNLKKILDVTSAGMICSLQELGFNVNSLTENEKDDILDLNDWNHSIDFTNFNDNICDYLEINNTIFHIDLPLNRSDCLGSFQFIVELASFFNLKIKNFDWDNYHFNNHEYDEKLINLKLDFKSSDIIENIFIEELQVNNLNFDIKDGLWLKHNNIVADYHNILKCWADKINLEMGQPVVLLASNQIKNLILTDKYLSDKNNNVVALLDNKDLICVLGDKVKPKYQILSDSKKILALSFKLNENIMRHQQKISNCYSKMMDQLIKPVSNLYTHKVLSELNLQLTKKNMLNKILLKESFYNQNINFNFNQNIKIKPNQINKLLGTTFTANEIANILLPLAFQTFIKDDYLDIKIPIIRNDIYNVADLAEEIARLYGYNKIISQEAYVPRDVNLLKKHDLNLEQKFNNLLLNNNFYEVKTYNLVSEEEFNQFNLFHVKNFVKLNNALSSNHEYLKPSGITNLFQIIKYNNHRQNYGVQIYNWNFIYDKDKYLEPHKHLAFAFQVPDLINFIKINYQKSPFFIAKNYFQNIINEFDLKSEDFDYKFILKNNLDIFNPYQTVEIFYNKTLIGIIGSLHPLFIKKNKMKNFYFVELDLTLLNKFIPTQKNQFIKSFKNNYLVRDLNLFLNNNEVKFQKLKTIIFNNSKYCQSIEIIDLFAQPKQESLKVTIRMHFNNKIQLTDKQVNVDFQNIQNEILAFDKNIIDNN